MNLQPYPHGLFKQLCFDTHEPNENVVYSPLSYLLAQSMLLLGSGEGSDTKRRLRMFLGVATDESLVEKLKNLNTLLNSEQDGVVTKLESKIYFDDDVNLLSSYSKVMKEVKCNWAHLRYKKHAEVLHIAINNWVAHSTENKIESLFVDLDPSTKFNMVNCICFKGEWLNEFHSSETMEPWCTDNKTTTFRMMHKRYYYYCTEYTERNVRRIEIPFKQKEFSMLLFLPTSASVFPAVLKSLSDNSFDDIKDGLREKKLISLEIPKLKFEFSTFFKTTPSEVYSEMSECEMRTSEVLHKAVLEMNEKGVVVTAATGSRYVGDSEPDEPNLQHFCDDSFVFVIRRESETLFAGKVVGKLERCYRQCCVTV